MSDEVKVKAVAPTSNSVNLSVASVVDTHLGSMAAYGSEAGTWLADKVKVLKADLSFEVEDAETAVRAWVTKHLHDSPVSRNTLFWNNLQPKLAALIADVRKAVGKL